MAKKYFWLWPPWVSWLFGTIEWSENLCFSFLSVEVHWLTGESTPAGDVAGRTVRQHIVLVWEAGWHDGVREGHRGRQLDQGNVVTAIVQTIHSHSVNKDKTCHINNFSVSEKPVNWSLMLYLHLMACSLHSHELKVWQSWAGVVWRCCCYRLSRML